MDTELAQVVFRYPAIDNHCHPLLSKSHKDDFALEGIFSEAQGPGLDDAEHTLAGYRVTKQLAAFFGCEEDWDMVKVKRKKLPYDDLCRFSFERAGIQCLLLDDGLNAQDACESITWHDRLAPSPSKRILRIEALAESILLKMLNGDLNDGLGGAESADADFTEDYDYDYDLSPTCEELGEWDDDLRSMSQPSREPSVSFSDRFSVVEPPRSIPRARVPAQPKTKQTARKSGGSAPRSRLQERESDKARFSEFTKRFRKALEDAALNPFVIGFKSIVCYRTGLDVFPTKEQPKQMEDALAKAIRVYRRTKKMRLAEKKFNDHLVRVTMEVAGTQKRPVQFHTGLGDNDIRLTKASPAHLQPLIEAFPNTPVVLLHSSYPFTREAGYLTAMYKNVFLDFGEIFPFLSQQGQQSVLHQIFEMCPTNKIMWSTDGHFWPETYFLASQQSREVLFKVLSQYVKDDMLSEQQAVLIVKNALFHNANDLYGLGLQPIIGQS